MVLTKYIKFHSDLQNASTTFIAFGMVSDNHCSGAEPPYTVRLIEGDVSVCIEHPVAESVNTNSSWLDKCFLPRFRKWCTSFCGQEELNTSAVQRVESLTLIDLEKYNQLYNELKEKYGIDMVKVLKYFLLL